MIEQTKTKIIYNVGTDTIFPFNVKFFDREDVKVKLNDEILVLNRDYEVEIKDNYANGANVFLIKEALPTDRLTIYRSLSLTQSLDLPEYGKLSAEALETALDRIVMSLQELAESSIHYNGDEQIDFQKIIADLAKVQGFVANADELSTSATKAAVSAAQALISAINAAQYAEAAKSVSGIPEHNNSELAHVDIRNLISDINLTIRTLQNAFNLHIEDYSAHEEDNLAAHQAFSKTLSEIDSRVGTLEVSTGTTAGNYYYAFGGNWHGQLGVNWTTNVTQTPMCHIGLRNVAKVAMSDTNSVAIANGRLFVTGTAGGGTCGPILQNIQAGFAHLPAVNELVGWTDCAVGRECAFAIYEGRIYSWGRGDSHSLGSGNANWQTVPTLVGGDLDVTWKQIECSGNMAIALTTDGIMYTTGWSDFGALGHQPNGGVYDFNVISGFDNVIQVAAGCHYDARNAAVNFCGAIKKTSGTNELWMWGANYYQNCGSSTSNILTSPTKVQTNFNPIKISCGGTHSAVLAEDGSVYVAGEAWALQTAQNTAFTKKEVGDEKIVDIACGMYVTYLVTESGKLLAFGANNNGSLLENPNSNNVVELVASGVEKVYASPMSQSCSFTYNEVADEVE